MDYKSFMEALKGKQHKIDKNKNGQIDAHDFKLLRKEETEELEEATVKTQKYSWGTMKTVHHGSDFSIPLHPEHHEAIAKLKDQQEHKFKDETNRHWTAKRSGDDVHFQSANNGPKTTVKHSTMSEEVEDLDEIRRMNTKLNTLDPISHMSVARQKLSDLMKSGKARGALIANKKRTLNMGEEVEQIDELSKGTLGSYVKKASRDATITRKIGADFENRADRARSPGMKDSNTELSSKYKQKSWKRRDGLEKAVDRLTKEEVEQIEERNKENAMMRKTMDASRGARYKLNNPVPDAEPEHKTAQAHNKAIGRALRNEAHMTTIKDKSGKLVSFKYEGDWKKTTKADAMKDPAGKVANMAGQAMQKMKMVKANEQAPVAPVPDRKYIKGTPENKALKASRKPINGMPTNKIKEEKDEEEYGYEGDMALNQLATLTRCAEMITDMLKPDTDLPEWVQSKITLATDYIQTAADYLYSENEMNEGNSVNVDKVNAAGHKPHEEKFETFKKPKKVKESFDDEGNLIANKVSYKEFMLEYTPGPGGVTQVKGRSYGASYTDPEGADDYDDKKPMKPAAEKRGRGRPAGAKSGARKITGTSKLMNK